MDAFKELMTLHRGILSSARRIIARVDGVEYTIDEKNARWFNLWGKCPSATIQLARPDNGKVLNVILSDLYNPSKWYIGDWTIDADALTVYVIPHDAVND